MKRFSYKTEELKESEISEPVQIQEGVKKNSNWHSDKAEFHRQASEFFKAAGQLDRAKFQSGLADEHEALSNV